MNQTENTVKSNTKKNNVKIVIGILTIVIFIAVMGILYSVYAEKPVAGSKSITIEVVNKSKDSVIYELQTDAEYLKQAMEDADGLTFDGEETEYGFTTSAVNGEKADFNVDAAYWSFYVNGEYCNYGISAQPVNDGDAFQIVYEVFKAE